MCCSSKNQYNTTTPYASNGQCGSGSSWFARRAAKKATMKALEEATTGGVTKSIPASRFIYAPVHDTPVQTIDNSQKAFSSYMEKLAKSQVESSPPSMTGTSYRFFPSGARRKTQAHNAPNNAEAPPSYHETIIRDAASARKRGKMDVERYRVGGH